MQKLLFFLPIALIASDIPPSEYISTQEVKLEKKFIGRGWTEDREYALKRAREENLPLLIAFVGPSWCPWSEKLEEEVLASELFTGPLSQRFILLRVPFPENFSQFTADSLPALSLKEQYGVVECPTLVLTTIEGKKMALIDYLPLKAEAFATYITELATDFSIVEKYASKKELKHLDLAAVKSVYKKAERLGSAAPLQSLIGAGLKKDKTPYFLLEQYKKIGESGDLFTHLGKKVRKKLLARDPENTAGSHREVALIDFEALSEKNDAVATKAIEPLVAYLQTFGKNDPENAWRIEMKMSQYLYGRDKIKEALLHAQASMALAPDVKKEEIASTIEYLQTKL